MLASISENRASEAHPTLCKTEVIRLCFCYDWYMIIGFSSGCLYKTHDPLDPVTIDIFKKHKCNAIEIMIHRVSDIDKFKKLKTSDIEGFGYTSIHAPIYKGEGIKEYVGVIQAIAEMHTKVIFNTVVLHPDMFDDFSFLERFDLPFAVENMDNRKMTCKDVESLQQFFNKFDMPMVLDVNHAFTNDPTMKLAEDLVGSFRPRIEEIHLSGFNSFHDPLYKTKQKLIIDAIPDINLPIIIESGLDSVEEVDIELNYIMQSLPTSTESKSSK